MWKTKTSNLFYLFLFILFCHSLHGQDYTNADFSPFIHTIEHILYKTDVVSSEENYIIALDDGSVWQVDPSQKEYISEWNIGDQVHIETQLAPYILSAA